MGSSTVTNGYDLSKHLALFSTSYGLSVSSGTINYVSGGVHAWYSGTTSRMTLSAAGALAADSSITSGGTITAVQNFQSSTAAAVLGPNGAGTVYLRPNGVGSGTGQTYVTNAGAMTVNGTLHSTGAMSTAGGFSATGASSFSNTLSVANIFSFGSFCHSTTTTAVFGTSGSGGTVYLRPNGYNSGTADTTINSAGTMAVSGAVTCAGLTSSGNITYSSDRRLKSRLKEIGGALDKVLQLSGYTYHRDDLDTNDAGLVAQEVQAVLPEAVAKDAKGMLTVAIGPVLALLVEAIKELASDPAV
jgi:hypothetical protein